MSHDAFEKYIEMSKNTGKIRRLESLFDIVKDKGFNLLSAGDHFFIIKMYIGKIAQIVNNKDGFEYRASNILKRHNLDLEDYTKNDYTTVAKEAESVAKTFIRAYRNITKGEVI